MQDIYLGLDPGDVGDIAEAMDDGAVIDLLADVPELTKRGRTRGFGDLPAVSSIARSYGLTDTEGQPRPLDEWLDAVSDLHLKWRNVQGDQFEMGDDPDLDREYDARLQVVPFDPENVDEFRNSLVYNLKCQIRDLFVEYGVNPPEGVRVTGPGDDSWTVTYMKHDSMENFHDPEAEVNWDVESWPDRDDENDGVLGLF